jgi:hypothetical protein
MRMASLPGCERSFDFVNGELRPEIFELIAAMKRSRAMAVMMLARERHESVRLAD